MDMVQVRVYFILFFYVANLYSWSFDYYHYKFFRLFFKILLPGMQILTYQSAIVKNIQLPGDAVFVEYY